jgi:NAD(P)H-hydrate epimerase
MMRHKLVTVSQIQKLDRTAIGTYGISSLILMENAGIAVSREAVKMVRSDRAPINIFCGVGNNGGDGFVAARHLVNAGLNVNVFIVGESKTLKSDAAVNYKVLVKSGTSVKKILRMTPVITEQIFRSSLCIDALFGAGLNRKIGSPASEVIDAINHYSRKVLAVDIPSGLDGTSGKIHGAGIRADVTVTMTFPKKGFYQNSGPQCCGRVVVADIGIPKPLIARILK